MIMEIDGGKGERVHKIVRGGKDNNNFFNHIFASKFSFKEEKVERARV